MAKPKITRTYGPIHFEDLDPHRFEDLIRELIYDYKIWQSIEATGRSGNDGGFDVRAYEKVDVDSTRNNDTDEAEEFYPMNGNLWMIQGKREKEIGPKKIKEILKDVDEKNPPYGYILAASANFSKDSYDAFREELRKKKVMEFYLWGKAELEDMLHLPKNDRILFTFFGISLVSQKRSRATEIRQVVINKNKLFSILGDDTPSYRSILLRDSKDTRYPYKNEYRNFDSNPRWYEQVVTEYHPYGLIFETEKYFAYLDSEKKEYDYIDILSLVHREGDSQEEQVRKQDLRMRIEDYWQFFPHCTQGTFFKNGLVRFDEMIVIDAKGDTWHKSPHIFIDFVGKNGPFAGFYEYIKVSESSFPLKGYKRVKKFPTSFPKQKIGKLHNDKAITLDTTSYGLLKRSDDRFFALFACDAKYDFLKQKDVLPITNNDGEHSQQYYLQITNIEQMKVVDYTKKNPYTEWNIENQIGKKPNPDEILNVYEFKKIYDFVLERAGKLKKPKHP